MSERTVRDRDSDRHRHYDRDRERRRERSSSPRRSSQHHSGYRRDHVQPVQMHMQMQPMMSHPALPLNATAQPYMPLNMSNMPNMPNMPHMSNMSNMSNMNMTNMPMVNMPFQQPPSMHQPPRAHRTFRTDASSSHGNTQCTNTVLIRNLPEELLDRRALFPVFGKYGRIAQLNLIIPKQQVFIKYENAQSAAALVAAPTPVEAHPHIKAMMAHYELEAQVELPPEPKTPLLSEEALNKLRVTLSEKQLEKQNIEGQIAHQKTLQEKINASAKLPAEDKIKMISKVNTVIGGLNKTLQTATESAAGVEGMIQTALAAIKASAERAAALSQRQREQQERRQQRMSNQNQSQNGQVGGRPFGFMMPGQQFMNQQPMMMMMRPQYPQQPMYGYPNQMQRRQPMNQRTHTPAIMQPGNQSTKFAANPTTPAAEEAPVVEPTWIYVQNVPEHDAIEASLRAHFENFGAVVDVQLHEDHQASVAFANAADAAQAVANGSVFDEHQLQLSLASESVMESLSQPEAVDGQAEEQAIEHQTEEYDPETEIYDDGTVHQDTTEEAGYRYASEDESDDERRRR